MVNRIRENCNDDPFAIVAHFSTAELRMRQASVRASTLDAKEDPLDFEPRRGSTSRPNNSIAFIALISQLEMDLAQPEVDRMSVALELGACYLRAAAKPADAPRLLRVPNSVRPIGCWVHEFIFGELWRKEALPPLWMRGRRSQIDRLFLFQAA